MISLGKIDKRKQIILATGCFLVLIGVIYRFFPEDLMFMPNSEERLVKEKQLQKMLDIIGQEELVKKRQAKAFAVLKGYEGGMLQAKTPSLASVEIQNDMTRIAEKYKIQIEKKQVISPEILKDKGVVKIKVRFDMKLSIRQLRDLLRDLQKLPEDLGVEYCKIIKGSDADPLMKTALTLCGFMVDNG